MGHGHHVNWDYDNDLKNNQMDRCRADFRNALSGIVKARIQYKSKVLTVWIDTLGSGEFTKCFTVNNVFLPKGYYFGVSAATGGLADYHDIYGFVTKDIGGGSAPEITESTPDETEAPYHKRHHGWYDPYEYYHKQIQEENEKRKKEEDEQSQPQAPPYTPPTTDTKSTSSVPDQPPTFGMADEEEHKFFENLREKLKHFGFDDSEDGAKKPDSKAVTPDDASFSTQTGLLILEALEEVARTVKSSSTKNDISQIIDRVRNVAAKQEQVQHSMQDMKEHLSSEVHSMLTELKTETNTLQREIRRLDSILYGINVQVDDLNAKQQLLGSSLENQLPEVRETIRKESSFGFWTFFAFFQIIFGVAVMYWKKYREVKSQKMY
jgi:mannose-binding lectin 1